MNCQQEIPEVRSLLSTLFPQYSVRAVLCPHSISVLAVLYLCSSLSPQYSVPAVLSPSSTLTTLYSVLAILFPRSLSLPSALSPQYSVLAVLCLHSTLSSQYPVSSTVLYHYSTLSPQYSVPNSQQAWGNTVPSEPEFPPRPWPGPSYTSAQLPWLQKTNDLPGSPPALEVAPAPPPSDNSLKMGLCWLGGWVEVGCNKTQPGDFSLSNRATLGHHLQQLHTLN